LILSIIATILCPILGVFPLVLSICSRKELKNNDVSKKKRSHYKWWIISLLIIEFVLLTIVVIRLWNVIMS